ncbi:scavenger receptor cysteine-rich type 1 protein M130-like [Centropristis striata]|uniref:scavenger receptor cysteine-rich type 1 protein M130-like n=1 Tax=Centropristis striata TaxID=184440 RepID=UPI0027E19C81|nr:scavenger receptor cysteine-rich type 1 protein M130-like [Centropristis striata]
MDHLLVLVLVLVLVLWGSGLQAEGKLNSKACLFSELVRLLGGDSHCAGTLELKHEGEWRPVDDPHSNWTLKEAASACRELDCGSAVSVERRAESSSVRSVWRIRSDCVQSGSALRDCVTSASSSFVMNLTCSDSVRLVNGNSLCSGRLKVKSDQSTQSWASVCEADFDQQDAEVVCRELGCGAPSVLQGALYGEVETPMWTKEFQCGGNETALLDCRSSGSDRNTCSPGRAVGLTCSEPVRLVGGDTRCAGTLEVKHEGEWRPVSNGYESSGWTLKEAAAACRKLVCGPAVSVRRRKASDRSVWWISSKCVQSGSTLKNCATSRNFEFVLDLTCSAAPRSSMHRQCIRVDMGAASPVAYLKAIILKNLQPPSKLTLQFFYKGMCAVLPPVERLSFLCQPVQWAGNGGEVSEASPIVEDHSTFCLNNCSMFLFSCFYFCTGLQAEGKQNQTEPVRLVGGDSRCAGTLELKHEGEWRPVSDQNFIPDWTQKRAAAACRDLDCGSVVSVGMRVESLHRDMWGIKHACVLSGSALRECALSTCSSTAVDLTCSDSVRLVNGTSLCSGRLDVKFDQSNQSWSSVCEADFDQQDAEVVCRELGCGAPSVLQGALYGEVETPMWTKEFLCGGDESALLDCRSSGSDRNTCSPGRAVGLTCSEPVRLVGGGSRCAGTLELKHEREWRPIYDSAWTLKDVAAVCRELDCGSAVSVERREESSDRSVWRIRSDCVQSGSALRECAYSYLSSFILDLTCSGGPLERHRNPQQTRFMEQGSSRGLDRCGRGFPDIRCRSSKGAGVLIIGQQNPSSDAQPLELAFSITQSGGHQLLAPPASPSAVMSIGVECAGEVEEHDCHSTPGVLQGAKSWGPLQTAGFPQDRHSLQTEAQVEDVQEHLTELVCTVPEQSGANAIQTRSLWSGVGLIGVRRVHLMFQGRKRRRDSVRLVDGNCLCSGRLELKSDQSNQSWSSVCEADFDQQDAEVVCRELGCGAPSALQGALYGEVETPMWTKEFQCGGNESALLDCRSSGSDRNTCSPGRAIGLTCSGPVRLVGGDSRCAGTLELKHKGEWRPVDDSAWILKTAAAACRDMDCGSAVSVRKKKESSYRSVWRISSDCVQSGSALRDCVTPWSSSNIMNITCSDSVRLVNGTSLCSGRLEVKFDQSNQSWSSVCEADFDQQDAEVVCRELGCGAPSALQGALYGEVETPLRTKEFQCGGNESALLDCRSSGSDRNTCSPGRAIGLTCSEPVRLVGGGSRCAGTLELKGEGEWRPVYDSAWTLKDVAAVCRDLSCGSAVSVRNRKESSYRSVWWIRSDCVQSGSALRDCASLLFFRSILDLTCSDLLLQPNISAFSSMDGVSEAKQQQQQQQEEFRVFRGSNFTISCSIQPQYPGGSFQLTFTSSNSAHNYTQPAVNHSADFLFPAAEPAHQGSYSCVYHVYVFNHNFSSESRLLSVFISDPTPFIIRVVVLPLSLLVSNTAIFFYCKATRGQKSSRRDNTELDYYNLGVPAAD